MDVNHNKYKSIVRPSLYWVAQKKISTPNSFLITHTMEIEDIAITGASGRFPNANNIEELGRALLSGIDLITDRHERWPHQVFETPPSMGIVHDFEHFDAAFFEINPKAAEMLDRRGGKLLEVVFEAIVDAGFNPKELKGSKTGVFVGIMQNSFDYDYLKPGSGISSSTYIIANNVSYIFDFHGPSCGIDTGCSSSIYALNQAVESMRLGVCDAAIVCSAHSNFLPYDSVEFNRLGVLNPEGRCKTFDDNRQGYVKSESVVAVLLQRRQIARRIYATISGVGCNVDGYKEEGLLRPSSKTQLALLRDVYQRYGIDPGDVTYVECHGTGTLVGDIEECEGLAKFFPRNQRDTPLRIGSVKTNLGHTEAAAGLVSLIKLLVVIQSGVIPANLHYTTPATDIPSILNEELNVVSQNTKYNGGLLAVNAFGLGGANGHLVIKPHHKTEHRQKQQSYRLVQVSGRTKEAVETFLEKINEKSDPGFLKLLDEVFSIEIKNHDYKGYCILNTRKRSISKCLSKKPPIWFSYSGMGSQWPQMAKNLVHFEIFRNALNKCAKALQPYSIDLKDIILNGTTETFQDTVNCFTSITAVSIGLTDILSSMGIKPDGIIGHSLGEIGCAYSDGLITAEEATLIAYARGLATKSTSLIPGLMASVGLPVGECEKLLPHGIYIACDNSPSNVTVAGPEESVRLFTEELSIKGVFVRIVNTANIAFHSVYVSEVGPKLLESLKTIRFQPKLRKLWLPSAVPECEWSSNLGRYNSVDYHCYNFLNRVLYSQVLRKVPKNAILIEVAPSGLFQAIFRRSLDESVTKLYLVKKHCEDNYEFLLDSIGRLYLAGGQPKLNSFYGAMEYPLGPETPMLSPIIKWNHVVKWSIPKYDLTRFFGKKVDINLGSREKFLLGHIVNGRNLLPVASFIILVWKTFANLMGSRFEDIPVIVEAFKVVRSISLPRDGSVIFTINILKTAFFEIIDKMGVVATGKIRIAHNVVEESCDPIRVSEVIKLATEDVYKILRLRGYEYLDDFRGIKEIDYVNKTGVVKWNKNWITFFDSLFQVMDFIENSGLVWPKQVFKIAINPKAFENVSQKGDIYLKYNIHKKSINCNGVTIQSVIWSKISSKKFQQQQVVNIKYEFVPNTCKNLIEKLEPEHVFLYILQIVIENNSFHDKIKIMEILETEIFSYKDLLKKLHPKDFEKIEYFTSRQRIPPNGIKYDLIILRNLEFDEEVLKLLEGVDKDTFIYSEVLNSVPKDFVVIFQRMSPKKSHVLLRKSKRIKNEYKIINSFGDNSCIAFENSMSKTLLIEEKPKHIPNYFKQLPTNNLGVFSIKNPEEFSIQSPLYQKQLEKNLTINILRNNEWGTYRYTPIEKPSPKIVDSCFVSLVDHQLLLVQQNPYHFKGNKVKVSYSSLDFWDQPTTNCLGLDYSGVDSGSRVMGIAPSGSLKTHLNPHDYFTWTIPKTWKMEEAATVPFAYTMCYYGLFIKGNIQSYNTILILYNSKSIDLAAINLISNTGCKLFVAITSKEDAKVLMGYFPKLQNNIVDLSCNRTKDIIIERTQGQGVDVAFTSGDIATSVLDVIKNEGKVIFINVTKNDIRSEQLDIISYKKCVLYISTFESLLRENNCVLEKVKNAIQTYADDNVIQPFNFDTIEVSNLNDEIPNGKIVVKILPKDLLNGNNKFLAQPRTYLNPEKCYIVISNLNVFDIEVIAWLSSRGAKKILLNYCNKTISGYITFIIEKLRKKGDIVIMEAINVISIEGVQKLVNSAAKLGSIGGIFYLSWSKKCELVDYYIVKNLDIASRSMCPNLDHFVTFSSRNPSLGEENFVYNQASIEGVCQDRKDIELPSLVIQWVDLNYEKYPHSISSCLKTLDDFMQLDAVLYSSTILDASEAIKGEVEDGITAMVAKIFGIQDVDQIDFNTPLVNFGMDSIMGFELKSLLSSKLGVNYSVSDIRKLTLEGIQNMEETR